MRSLFLLCGLLSLVCPPAYAQNNNYKNVAFDPEFDELLKRDLSSLTVTSVAKHPQRLQDAAAAIYVITQEEIRRAGIYTIPEALRLVPGMEVARIRGDRWAVTSRGFNGSLNNKLLVLIDGRAIYTPVFSGVYWGDQSTTINDIERIEVIRGPGATIHGANAVNGVVNIITKSAEDTQGTMLSATATVRGNGIYEARQGGKIGEDDYFRMYGQYLDASSWYRARTGFRMDGRAGNGDSFTMTGNVYTGTQDTTTTIPILTTPFTQTVMNNEEAHGAHLLARWNRRLSYESEWSLQAYVDHYARLEYNADQQVSTADLQFQHNLRLNDRNYFVWGANGRLYYQNLSGGYIAGFNERYDTHEIVSAFFQNEYAILPNELYLTAGSKFEYNDFTGFEFQPSVRLSWAYADNQTLWAAVSRAVRTPSSIEEDINLLAQVQAGPTELRIFGNQDQKAEELIAYEIGHRIQPLYNLSFDTALFYNDYDRLQTFSPPGASFIGPNGNLITPYSFNNEGYGHVYGAEIAATWYITTDWRLAGSYSYLKLDLEVNPGMTAATLQSTQNLSPRHQFAIQSFYNISDTVHWDNMLYYVDDISTIDGYIRYDTRIAWLAMPGLEVSLIGRNLVDEHAEFPTTPQTQIDRSFIGQVLWKF